MAPVSVQRGFTLPWRRPSRLWASRTGSRTTGGIMPARNVLRHSARRHILWRWHPAPHAATPARQARSVGVHPGSLLAVKPLKTELLSVTADAPPVTARIGSFEEMSGDRGEEKNEAGNRPAQRHAGRAAITRTRRSTAPTAPGPPVWRSAVSGRSTSGASRWRLP